MDNGDKPSAPINGELWKESDESAIKGAKPLIGLTKREHLAAMAMQGILSSMTEKAAIGHWGNEETEIAIASTIYADALLKELDK